MSNQAQRPGHGDQRAHPTEREADHADHSDDAIVVPKGTSRLKFLFLLFLTIFVLITFTVGDQLLSSVGRPSTGGAEVTWDGPLVGKRSLDYGEFLDAKRREDDYNRLLRIDRSELADETLAGELLVDEIAQASGIAVSDQEVGRAILDGFPQVCPPFQTKETYDMILASQGITARSFEGVLRRKLRIQRYQALLRGATQVADSAKLEEVWKKDNPQWAFDVIELEHSKFDAEAQAAKPDLIGLAAWYEAIPEKRIQFFADYLPATSAAEIVFYRPGGDATAEGLLAKFPAAPDKDAEQAAKDYYNQYSSVRFVRETPLPDDQPTEQGKDRLILSYDEVAETARKDSAVLEAMRAFVADVKRRKAEGATVDLAAEAAAMNLSYRASDVARSEADWAVLEGIGGPFLARSILGAQKDDFGADVAVDRGGFGFVRVLEKNATAPPPFDKVAEKAGAEWIKQKCQELAIAKLTALRDSLPKPADAPAGQNPKADEAAFKAAAEAAGLSVYRRDWMSQAEQNADPDVNHPVHEFLRFNGYLRNAPVDEVSPVLQDRMRTRSFVARTLGQREPPQAKLRPTDVDNISRTLANQAFVDFVDANFSPKALSESYKLRLRGSKEIPEPGA